MSLARKALKRVTALEYLAQERESQQKHEFYQGEVFAMSGASLNHNKLVVNFLTLLAFRSRGSNCKPYASDLRLHIPANTLYTYPDILVICGKEEMLDDTYDTVLNPVFLCEVLSPSTADYDTGGKFALYRSVPSLKEYWTVSSYHYQVQKYVRLQTSGQWVLTEVSESDKSLLLECLNIEIDLNVLYDGIHFKSRSSE